MSELQTPQFLAILGEELGLDVPGGPTLDGVALGQDHNQTHGLSGP